ncbi:efflux RND transporter periplasmic adaptor subunit [Vibrio sp. Isolate30]|uniref:efflux RND transporter periplasmic adaptor subunit n=1 Tax=Vibrio sp. Isolate30 TaxID=2908536 RepID=UPI001EFE6B00|nr:efflux RND transporter periplasmic adaptor subunit [Vibrio sp. Isolate30]MCG9630390.1 efflux RND transporter periplasmic adaptor subunit [Vibrio sp. Isolate30]
MKFKKPLSIALGCVAILAALILVDELEPDPVTLEEKEAILAPVSVIEVTPTTYEASLNLLAVTQSRWPIQLKASSSAQLAWVNLAMEPGTLIKEGDVLAKLDNSALRSNVAMALSQVKQAELNLKQIEHEQTVALKMLNPSKSSAFARKEPQVAAAKAELTQAKQAYQSATKLLKEATIVAPFDAVILNRHVSPGEWIEAGQATFDLAASDSIDVALPVSELHWARVQQAVLKGQEASQPEIIVVGRSGQRWPAAVRYVSPNVDPVTRQRQVVLSVQNPYQVPRLFPNQQVEVKVNLGEQTDVSSLPISSLTRDGYVWTLDSHDQLQKERVTLVEETQEQVHVKFSDHKQKTRSVVKYPLSSMLAGKQVAPIRTVEALELTTAIASKATQSEEVTP